MASKPGTRRMPSGRGRNGFLLEAWKFSIYLALPIAASVYFNDPERQRRTVEYWQYVKYPANPTTGYKEQIEKALEQEDQRKVYREQLMKLNQPREKVVDEVDDDEKPKRQWRWLLWVGLGSEDDA